MGAQNNHRGGYKSTIMKISILTTLTKPKERQDKFEEALACYKDIADEVVIVDGSNNSSYDGRVDDLGKMKVVYLHWPEEWNWIELPRHLNEGLKQCSGDWIVKLDIDQFMKKEDFIKLREKLSQAEKTADCATVQKMSFIYGGKYYHKGESILAFRNKSGIVFGKDLKQQTDLCFPINQTGVEVIYQSDIVDGKEINRVALYELPIGYALKVHRTDAEFWNYDYYFKTQEFTRKEFWRFSRAFHRYYGEWRFGESEEKSFQVFLDMQKGRYKKAPHTATDETHPIYIRDAIKNLTPDCFGHSGWSIV